ncbi:hypothetical protein [Desulfomicrobium salsuginis]
MSCIEEALTAIDTGIEALELIYNKEAADFVSDECISMLARLIRDELAFRSGIIRGELQQSRRKVA